MTALPTGCELIANDAHRQGQEENADEGENGSHDVAQKRGGIIIPIACEVEKNNRKTRCWKLKQKAGICWD